MDPAMAGCTEGTSRRTPLAQVPADFWSSDSHRLCNVDRHHDELAQAELERLLVRLLPYFDSFLLGHKEREHLMAMEHRPKVYRPQGWIAPVVLGNGRGAAVWEHAREGT